MKKYTEEEKQILDSVEANEWNSVANVKEELTKAKTAAITTTTKNKNINIRVTEADITKLKAKSVEAGIPYQTIVSALIHNYATGRISLAV